MKNKKIVKLIESYQQDKSLHQTPKCRYFPTCSEYAKQCYQKFNFVKASLLTTKRLLKCNPFSKGGYDPVPLTKEEKLEQEKYEKDVLEKYKDEKETEK